MGDMLLDVCFILLAIAGTAFVVVNRKRFDMWLSLLTCTAWIIKGARYLCYDWILAAVNHMKADEVFLFMRKAHVTLNGMDALVNLFLYAALIRLVILGLFSRWYKKALKSLHK